MSETLKLPVGIEDFQEIRKEGFYYVDKTKLIEQLLANWGKVNLFTRPRRFGKTLNMSMSIFKALSSVIYYISSFHSQYNISIPFIDFFSSSCFTKFRYFKVFNITATIIVFYRIHDFNHNNTPIILNF